MFCFLFHYSRWSTAHPIPQVFASVVLLMMLRYVVLQLQVPFLLQYSRQPVWHIIIGKNYILEELTTEGDRIPKIKLHENIHRHFLCTLGEENSEVEGKADEGPQKRVKEENYFWYQTQKSVIWKSTDVHAWTQPWENTSLPHTHPTPQTNEKGKPKISPIKSSSFLSRTNLVNQTSKWKHSSPWKLKIHQAAQGCSMASFIAIPNSRRMSNWV